MATKPKHRSFGVNVLAQISDLDFRGASASVLLNMMMFLVRYQKLVRRATALLVLFSSAYTIHKAWTQGIITRESIYKVYIHVLFFIDCLAVPMAAVIYMKARRRAKFGRTPVKRNFPKPKYKRNTTPRKAKQPKPVNLVVMDESLSNAKIQ